MMQCGFELIDEDGVAGKFPCYFKRGSDRLGDFCTEQARPR